MVVAPLYDRTPRMIRKVGNTRILYLATNVIIHLYDRARASFTSVGTSSWFPEQIFFGRMYSLYFKEDAHKV